MKLEYRNASDPTKVLGVGDYWLDHDDKGNLIYTGLWLDGKVVALVVGANEDAYSDYIFANADEIVGRVNVFSTLVNALATAEEALRHSVSNVNDENHAIALDTVRKALVAADLA